MSRKVLLFGSSALVFLNVPVHAFAQWNVGQQNVIATGLPGGSIYNIISVTLSWLLAVLGFIAIAGFVISGIQYLLSAGDEGIAERAKNAMKYSFIGVIVALMGYVVIRAVNTWLLGTSVTF